MPGLSLSSDSLYVGSSFWRRTLALGLWQKCLWSVLDVWCLGFQPDPVIFAVCQVHGHYAVADKIVFFAIAPSLFKQSFVLSG